MTVELITATEFVSLAYTSKQLNAVARKRWIRNSVALQRILNVYGTMRLTRDQTFHVDLIEGSAMVWQPDLVCGWNPIRSTDTGDIEVTPVRIKLNDEICLRTDFNGLFDFYIENQGDGTTEPDAEVHNTFLDAIGQGAMHGLRLQGLIGGIQAGLTPQAGVSAENVARFTATKNTNQGVFTKVIADGLNNPDLLPDTDFAAGKYTGSVLDLYESLLSAGGTGVQTLVQQGAVITDGSTGGQPFILMSPVLGTKLYAEIRAMNREASANNAPLGFETYTAEGVTLKVPTIQGIPVLVDPILGYYDKITGATTAIMAITATQNIQFGLSFSDVGARLFGTGFGLTATRSNLPGQDEKLYVASKTLIASIISDMTLASIAARVIPAA